MKYLRTKKKLVGTALIATMLVAITPNIAMAANVMNVRVKEVVRQQQNEPEEVEATASNAVPMEIEESGETATKSNATPQMRNAVENSIATTSNAVPQFSGVEGREARVRIEPKLIPLGVFKTTGYCPCRRCCGKYKTTATGTIPQPNHTIAVDPRVIPYGSRVMINGIIYTAEDCGGGVKRNHIDIFYSSHTVARYHGVQHAQVFLVVG